jgi:cellulose synthase/poly-beta-1,6-N-acetylglucosamine synthase-like glycosyltransferase
MQKGLYEELGSGMYTNFTVDRYNQTVKEQISREKFRLGKLATFSILTGFAFPQGPIVNTAFDALLHSLKFSWLIQLPYFVVYNTGVKALSQDDLIIDVKKIIDRKEDISGKEIIYTVVTRGLNINSVEGSAKSVVYWTNRIREKYNLELNSEVWVITEEDAYKNAVKRYDRLREFGVKVFAVPSDYRTRNNTKFKARALNYATELRRDFGLNTKNDWIYHQDEETMVGEDTILGNLDFILNYGGERVYGCGIILYPQNWKNKVTFVGELARSSDDYYRILSSVKIFDTAIFGYHGSHFMCRADAEQTVGWDFGECKAEDLVFIIKMHERFKKVAAIMRGFAYEKPPFTVGDHLKQRRRWFLGAFEFMKRDDIKLKNKIAPFYSLMSWFCAVPSLAATILNILHPTGGVFGWSGALTGFVWYSIFNIIRDGYSMHNLYLDNKPKKFDDKLKLISNAMLSILLESFAPWYALFKRTPSYEVIKKDGEN